MAGMGRIGGKDMRQDERIAELSAALRECQEMQPKAIQMIRDHDFIFTRSLPNVVEHSANEKTIDEWEKLAFSLYTYLAEINTICREVLEEEE
jgi:hypothetical protein